jgi:5'-3' exonuclease
MHARLTDANGLGYAEFFLRQKSENANLKTHAIAGFLEHMRGRLRYAPEVLPIIIWDGRAQWRYDLLPTYKSGRHRTPEQRAARLAYEEQRIFIRKALRFFPVIQLYHPGAEAEDVAYGLSHALAAQGHLVDLDTADTDWLQTVTGRVRWVNARRPGNTVEIEGFAKATGFATPALYAQGKALAGDDTDDIIGVPGVAMGRSSSLIGKYGDLANVLAASEDLFRFSQEPKYYRHLMLPEVRERVRQNLPLVDLSRGPALKGTDIEVEVGSFEELELAEFFSEHNLMNFLDDWLRWERALGRPMQRADVLAVQRAVQGIEKSWPAR